LRAPSSGFVGVRREGTTDVMETERVRYTRTHPASHVGTRAKKRTPHAWPEVEG